MTRQSGGREGGSTSTDEERKKSGEQNNRRREEAGEGGEDGVSEDRESSDLCVAVYISQDPQEGAGGGRKEEGQWLCWREQKEDSDEDARSRWSSALRPPPADGARPR